MLTFQGRGGIHLGDQVIREGKCVSAAVLNSEPAAFFVLPL